MSQPWNAEAGAWIVRYKQSPALEVIDQSFLTRRRIARDVQTALGIIFIAAALFLRDIRAVVLLAVVISVASVLARPAVQRLIRYTLPRSVQDRLPHGPLDVAERIGPPHSYRDLVRIWRDPAWHCQHRPDLRVPLTATNAAIAVPTLALFAIAAVAIMIEIIGVQTARLPPSLRLSAPVAFAGSAIVIQLLVTVLWNRRLRRSSVDLPSSSDVWITFFIAAIAVFAGLLIALAATN